MDIGMLWFDNSTDVDLQTKITRAADYYQRKYGQAATLCIVNPGTLGSATLPANRLEIRSAQSVLPNHFWIGVNERLH
jgi:hypothetical protein